MSFDSELRETAHDVTSFYEIGSIIDWLFGPVDSVDGGRHPRRGVVPNVCDLPLDQARTALTREGFKLSIHRLELDPASVMGIVVAQHPAPGSRWNRSRPVRLDVWHPPAP
jgi:hypothetical protein